MAVAAGLALLIAAPPSAEPPPPLDWITCSSIRTPRDEVFVDQITWVIFDSGSARIDAAGAEMLDVYVQGFEQAGAPGHCTVFIAAHADRQGGSNENVALSCRRASAVAAYLRRRGLTARIVIEAFGETRPAVETSEGIAEAQNRRVDVYVGESGLPHPFSTQCLP